MSLIHSLRPVALLTLLFTAPGCGKIPEFTAGGGGDGGLPDGAPPVGSAQLTVFHDDGTKVVGAVVVQTRRDGTHVTTVETDDQGDVELDVIQGDTAHVGFEELTGSGQLSRRLFTIDYLHVDDYIEVNNRPDGDDTGATIGSATVTLQPLPMAATRGEIVLGNRSSFDTSVTNNTVPISGSSVDERGKLTFVALAKNDADIIVATSVVTDVDPPQTNGTIAVVMPPWTPAMPNTSVMLTNVPAEARSVQVRFTSFRNRLEYQREERLGLLNLPTQTFAMTIPFGYADTIQHITEIGFPKTGDPTQPDGMVLLVSKRLHSPTEPYMAQVDAANTLPRLYESNYDAATGTFAWMTRSESEEQTARLDAADLVVLAVGWQANAGEAFNQWVVLAPGGRGSPVNYDLHDAASFAPPADLRTIPVLVQVLDIDAIEDYQQIKNDFGTGFLEGGIDTLDAFEGAASFSGGGFN